MTYGIGGTTTGYNTHVAGTGGYCKITQEAETPFEGYTEVKELNVCKLPRKVIREYYKYQYNDWTQPTLTANGTMGGDSFAVSALSTLDTPRQPWRAFDGSNSNPEQDCWHSTAGTTGWFAWYNPNPIAIEKFTVANRNDNSGIKDFTLQYSDNNKDWFDLQSYTNSSGGYTVTEFTVNTQSYHKYWRLNISSGYSNYLVIGEITINGIERTSTNGTADNYDYYEDIIKYYGII